MVCESTKTDLSEADLFASPDASFFVFHLDLTGLILRSFRLINQLCLVFTLVALS